MCFHKVLFVISNSYAVKLNTNHVTICSGNHLHTTWTVSAVNMVTDSLTPFKVDVITQKWQIIHGIATKTVFQDSSETVLKPTIAAAFSLGHSPEQRHCTQQKQRSFLSGNRGRSMTLRQCCTSTLVGWTEWLGVQNMWPLPVSYQQSVSVYLNLPEYFGVSSSYQQPISELTAHLCRGGK